MKCRTEMRANALCAQAPQLETLQVDEATEAYGRRLRGSDLVEAHLNIGELYVSRVVSWPAPVCSKTASDARTTAALASVVLLAGARADCLYVLGDPFSDCPPMRGPRLLGKYVHFDERANYGIIESYDGSEHIVSSADVEGEPTRSRRERLSFELWEGFAGISARRVRAC